MNGPVLLDTGPLVAYLDRRDGYHEWAVTQFRQIRPPQFTCESVLSESLFLLSRVPDADRRIIELLTRGVIAVSFRLDEELMTVFSLLARYRDVPMSLADACLVRMSELLVSGVVLTTDSDFRQYRKHRRQVIPTIMPDDL